MGVNAETPVSPLPKVCWYVGFRIVALVCSDYSTPAMQTAKFAAPGAIARAASTTVANVHPTALTVHVWEI